MAQYLASSAEVANKIADGAAALAAEEAEARREDIEDIEDVEEDIEELIEENVQTVNIPQAEAGQVMTMAVDLEEGVVKFIEVPQESVDAESEDEM